MWNKIAALMVLATTASLLLTPLEVEARGGRGGGGGGRSAGGARSGGGGAYRGGHTMNRTPTMSRAASRPASSQTRQYSQARPSAPQTRQQTQARQQPQTRPSAPQTRQHPQTRPSGSQIRQNPQTRPSGSQSRSQQARQTVQQRPSAANRTELRNQVNRYTQSRPAQNIDRQSLDQKTQNFSNNRNNQITQNRQVSNRVSQHLHQSRPGFDNWFDQNFFDHHHIDLDYVGTGTNWWRPAAWATLATWGAWDWSTPYYYDNGGDAYPITTIESTYTYPSATTESTYAYPYSTTTTPYQSVQTQPMQSAQTPASTGEEWLPLGVFAVAHNANAAAQTNRFIQLAINRSGEIAGVLYNSATDAAQDLTGMVDPKSQKAYWSMSNRTDSPIASTGIYNLTEDQTSINVHFVDGSDQTWTLVRLQQE